MEFSSSEVRVMTFSQSVGIYLRLFFFLTLPFIFWEGAGVFELSTFAIFSYLISSLALAISCSNQSSRILTIMFWLFSYIFLVVAAVAQQVEGVFPWIDFYNENQLEYAWFVVFAGFLAFFCGNLQQFSVLKTIVYPASVVKFKIFFCFSVIVTALSVSMYGGFSVLFVPREEMFSIFEGDVAKTMILQAMIRVPLFVCSVFLLQDFIIKLKGRNLDFYSSFLMLLTLVAVFVINNPISTPRFWLACVFITYMLIIFEHFSRAFNFKVACLIILMMLVAFPVSDVFRRSTNVSIVDYAAEQKVAESIIVSPNFDAFQQIVNTISYVDAHGHTWGGQSVSALFFWVPRNVWEGKAISTGELVAINSNYDYLNLSAPLWAEMYLDFGIAGVIFVFYILGRVLHSLELNSDPNIRVITCFIASYSMYFYRGSLMSVLSFLIITALFIVWLRRWRT